MVCCRASVNPREGKWPVGIQWSLCCSIASSCSWSWSGSSLSAMRSLDLMIALLGETALDGVGGNAGSEMVYAILGTRVIARYPIDRSGVEALRSWKDGEVLRSKRDQ